MPSTMLARIQEKMKANIDGNFFSFPWATFPTMPELDPDPKQKGYTSHFLIPKQVTLRYVQGWGQGVEYGTDYSTVSAFFATDDRCYHLFPLVDLRVHRFNNNTYAANFGVGGRYVFNRGFFQLWGLNAFYDFRQGNVGNFSQVGAGIELLSKRLDFRANCYYPVGHLEKKKKFDFEKFNGGFFAFKEKVEKVEAYSFNAEVGWLAVNGKKFLLYTAIGPYALSKRCCGNETLGGKFRLKPQYKDYIAVDFILSYDPLFKTVFQAEFVLNFPLYQFRARKCSNLSERQIYQPIERFEIIPLEKRCFSESNF